MSGILADRVEHRSVAPASITQGLRQVVGGREDRTQQHQEHVAVVPSDAMQVVLPLMRAMLQAGNHHLKLKRAPDATLSLGS